MTTLRIQQLLRAMTVEDLATQFVLMTTGNKRHGKLYTSKDVTEELDRRVGPVQLQVEIQHARDTLKLLGLTDVDMKRY